MKEAVAQEQESTEDRSTCKVYRTALFVAVSNP